MFKQLVNNIYPLDWEIQYEESTIRKVNDKRRHGTSTKKIERGKKRKSGINLKNEFLVW